MFGSRRNRPSLIGRAAHTAARTAVIAGTATAVSGAVAGRQAAKAGAAGAAAAPLAVETPPAAGLSPEAIEQLKQLADLNRQGILTDEEFATQKARLLG
ncbi:MAG: SHOCT domain-containing protein [Rhizobiaceae bacterium]|nr:SHOCT domain-containing protein [Rhizobiaceae bacterium]